MNKKREDLNVGKDMTGEKILLTKSGYEDKKNRLKELVNIIRPQILKELKAAREQGDLSENADYDTAKNKQAKIESEIFELEDILSKVKIVDIKKSNNIQLGSIVEYQKKGERGNRKVQIVGSIEANSLLNLPQIGNDSPFAKSLLNHKKGDVVTVITPIGNYEIKIISVKN
ncbi:Transcript cleavage factor greA [Candidatus Hepatoplasma crinochetorum Av]|jgi:transcription elongation factor GreA|uniref:Transcription elongation factor GreA n=1 Tax=Candidatus Hepatoplasma crinochetorum Av TaxID=1427984 RepID=W8GSN2_9MOLU|nr:transcription elongation factor GreA [Candidatus Hepatoplasma crinochetorum]AHK22410.1 Transcript cleavage factor greA [Candidatus Hepatoplasma crinochetorum Av]